MLQVTRDVKGSSVMEASLSMLLPMKRIGKSDYLAYASMTQAVYVAGTRFELGRRHRVSMVGPGDENPMATESSIWSFPRRGNWATHRGDYRGNWSPKIPRRLIARFTVPCQWVLDPMMGGGTTLIESKLMGRNAIGIDVNLKAVMIARDRLRFEVPASAHVPKSLVWTFLGDARYMNEVTPRSIDLVTLHPPYWNLIQYTDGIISGDLSRFSDPGVFLREFARVARECQRVLKPRGICAVQMGDARVGGVYVPLSHETLAVFLGSGFVLLEDVIKVQHNTRSERTGSADTTPFCRIAHEHIFVLRKEREGTCHGSNMSAMHRINPAISSSGTSP